MSGVWQSSLSATETHASPPHPPHPPHPLLRPSQQAHETHVTLTPLLCTQRERERQNATTVKKYLADVLTTLIYKLLSTHREREMRDILQKAMFYQASRCVANTHAHRVVATPNAMVKPSVFPRHT